MTERIPLTKDNFDRSEYYFSDKLVKQILDDNEKAKKWDKLTTRKYGSSKYASREAPSTDGIKGITKGKLRPTVDGESN